MKFARTGLITQLLGLCVFALAQGALAQSASAQASRKTGAAKAAKTPAPAAKSSPVASPSPAATSTPAPGSSTTTAAASPAPTLPNLTITHFDVGTGDATLIMYEFMATTPGGKPEKVTRSVLIDGGSMEMAKNVVLPGLVSVLPTISKDGKTLPVLDFAIATHYDREHREGLQTVIHSVSMSGLGAVYDRDRGWPSAGWPLDSQQKPPAGPVENPPLQPGAKLEWKDGKGKPEPVEIRCVAANGATAGWRWTQTPLRDNAQSVAFLVTFGKFSYFIGGDLTGGGQSGWNSTPDIESTLAREVGQVTVLRVNHHGGGSSSNQSFLAALNPTVAIISTGKTALNDRLFHWPSRKVLDRLNKLRQVNAVYITGAADTLGGLTEDDKKKVKDTQGTIKIKTVGDGTFEVNQTLFPKEEAHAK